VTSVGGLGIALFTISFAAVALIYSWKVAAPVMPFLYSNARVQARSKVLIPDSQWSTLSESRSLQDLIGALRETSYADALDKVENIREFHIEIEKGFVETVEELKRMTPDSINPLFDAYLMFWGAKMLKAVYRAKFTGQEIESLLLFPVGDITDTLLKHLEDAKTLADVRVIMEGTPYSPVFKESYTSLEAFEVALDNFVLGEFVRRATEIKTFDGKHIVALINTKFDIQNLLVLLKLEARHAPRETRKEYLIKNNTELFRRADELVYAKSVKGLVEKCVGTGFEQPLAAALEKYERDSSLSHFEHELCKFYKNIATNMERYHVQGPFPLFSYMVKKEIEMKNLMAVSKGVDTGMPPEAIMELII